eukprot:augustus_masked-scaffold_89-processed-gene-0.1-mRNA-1 protein AED:0.49 eAED:0.51 QI:0/-1/0/1/-1/1/1/0/652
MFRSKKRIDSDVEEAILTRQLSIKNHKGGLMGQIKLKTPKGVGEYDFRYYVVDENKEVDQNENEVNIMPISRSNAFIVDVNGVQVLESLSFLQQWFSKNKLSAISQLIALINQIRPEFLTNDGLHGLLKLVYSFQSDCFVEVEKSISQIEKLKSQKLVERYTKLEDNRRNVVSEGKELSKEEFEVWRKSKFEYLKSQKLYTLKGSLIVSVKRMIQCFVIFLAKINLVDENVALIKELLSKIYFYCPISEQFFPSFEEMSTFYRERFSIPLEQQDYQPSALFHRRLFGLDFGLNFVSFLNKDSFSHSALIEDSLLQIVNQRIPSDDFFETRLGKLKDLENTLNGMQSEVDMEFIPFGSCCNHFGTEASDLDVTVKHSSSKTATEILQLIGENLKEMPLISNLDETRLFARIPILRFVAHELEIDVCVNNELAIRNTKLLEVYAKCNSKLVQMAHIVKFWAKNRGINNPARHTLPSYGYILMIIYFLQRMTPPMLPNLQEQALSFAVAPVSTKGNHEKYFDTTFLEDPIDFSNVAAGIKLKDLLVGFFWFYSLGFDASRIVVSIRTNGMVLKEDKAVSDGWEIKDRLSIEDPFEISYDVAHVLSERGWGTMKMEFLRAFTILTGQYNEVTEENVVEKLVFSKVEEKQQKQDTDT